MPERIVTDSNVRKYITNEPLLHARTYTQDDLEAEIERLRTLLWHWRWTGYSKQRDVETEVALGNWRPNVEVTGKPTA